MAPKTPKKPTRRPAAAKTAARKSPARASKSPAPARRVAPAAPPGEPTRRVGLMELGGKPATIVGDDVQVGQPAPTFTAQVGLWPGFDTWAEVEPLAVTAGKVRILAAVPSLDTSTCDLETRRFNTEAAGLGASVQVITISTDLPVAQKRWCGAAGVDRVAAVSDHMHVEFGTKYGVLMAERRWLRRAVFVVDPAGVLRYVAYLPRLSEQPDYEAVLAIARQLARPQP
jgi:thiol peroxidase